MSTKYIFFTGGVVSSLGKGIACSSLGLLLKARGHSVTIIKLDPYINVDPGTMSPYQHGEVYVTDGLESAEATARIVVVVNPNNPDGRIFDRDTLAALARRLGAKGGLLVVDEAFCDVAPNASIADQAGREGLVVLRSLGKFYGLAGVRLGAALTNSSLGQRLDDRLGPWAVSGPALKIGTFAWADIKWQNRTLRKLQTSREDLYVALRLTILWHHQDLLRMLHCR